MQPDLPPAISGYIAAANTSDIAAISGYFADDARVKDEGQWREGRQAIEQWARETREKFDFRTTPLSAESERDATIVTARVEGNFPGSPITLRYRFELAGDRIARLEIV